MELRVRNTDSGVEVCSCHVRIVRRRCRFSDEVKVRRELGASFFTLNASNCLSPPGPAVRCRPISYDTLLYRTVQSIPAEKQRSSYV